MHQWNAFPCISSPCTGIWLVLLTPLESSSRVNGGDLRETRSRIGNVGGVKHLYSASLAKNSNQVRIGLSELGKLLP
jgi:hypothetical protein